MKSRPGSVASVAVSTILGSKSPAFPTPGSLLWRLFPHRCAASRHASQPRDIPLPVRHVWSSGHKSTCAALWSGDQPRTPTHRQHPNRPAARRGKTAASRAPSSVPAEPPPCRTDAESSPASAEAAGHSAISSGPTRFFITASACRVAGGSGRPAIERICSSNWLTGQASIVQWPELCGRGAISFTSTRAVASTNISTASSPTRSSAAATRRAIACAASPIAAANPRRRQRQVQDVVAMPVLHRVERATSHRPRRAPRRR